MVGVPNDQLARCSIAKGSKCQLCRHLANSPSDFYKTSIIKTIFYNIKHTKDCCDCGCLERCKMRTTALNRITCFLSELMGTALIVFLGCIGCVHTPSFENNHLQSCLNFGLVILIVVQIFACISGSHLNPAVTVAAVVYKLVDLTNACIYVVAQLIGGYVGYVLLTLVLPANAVHPKGAAHGLCVTTTHKDITVYQGFGIEFMITSVLVLCCCAVWDPRNHKFHDSVPIRFGLAVASLAITGGQFTGASMNPARSLGPALWHRDFTDHWVYWCGPVGGAAVSSIFYKTVFRREVPEEK